jgi:transcriptional regulator with XRE-family HTH domain
MKLSEIVRKYRADHDLSQREFAKRCGLSNSYISFIENECNPKTGRPITPTIEQYKKIADAMSISVQDLFLSLDSDAPVVLNGLNRPLDLQWFAASEPEPEPPKTDDVRLLIRGLNKLSPEQIEQAKNVFLAMFKATNPDLFDEGDDDK